MVVYGVADESGPKLVAQGLLKVMEIFLGLKTYEVVVE